MNQNKACNDPKSKCLPYMSFHYQRLKNGLKPWRKQEDYMEPKCLPFLYPKLLASYMWSATT